MTTHILITRNCISMIVLTNNDNHERKWKRIAFKHGTQCKLVSNDPNTVGLHQASVMRRKETSTI